MMRKNKALLQILEFESESSLLREDSKDRGSQVNVVFSEVLLVMVIGE